MNNEQFEELMREKLTIDITRKELSIAIQCMIRLEQTIEQNYRTELDPNTVTVMEQDMKDLRQVYIRLKKVYGKHYYYAYKKYKKPKIN